MSDRDDPTFCHDHDEHKMVCPETIAYIQQKEIESLRSLVGRLRSHVQVMCVPIHFECGHKPAFIDCQEQQCRDIRAVLKEAQEVIDG